MKHHSINSGLNVLLNVTIINKTMILLLGFVMISTLAYAQNNGIGTSLDSIINENTHHIYFDGQHITGSGADWLVNEAIKANYFLIGERHGTANIPKISGAIYSKLSKVGYHHAALEFGLFAGYKTQELIKNGGYNALKTYLETPEYFQAIAFLDWAEEAQLVDLIAKSSPLKEKAIWGLDQEFLFGFKMYLDMLENASQGQEQKQAIQYLKEALHENRFLMGGPLKTKLTDLKSLFDNDNQSTALIKVLITSNEIYSRFRGEITPIESSTIRETLMKKTFAKLVLEYEHQTGASTKVFFKFGGFHAAPNIGKGKSSLGTFVEEWAISRDETAFNIYIDANGGKTLLSGQDQVEGGDGTTHASSSFGKIDKNEFNKDIRHVFSVQLDGNTKLFLIDLRPLRKNLHILKPYLNSSAIKLISGFDAYLAMPNVSPGTPFKSKK